MQVEVEYSDTDECISVTHSFRVTMLEQREKNKERKLEIRNDFFEKGHHRIETSQVYPSRSSMGWSRAP